MTRELTLAREMISADLLRLRKKRGFMALVLGVMLAPMLVAIGYNVIEHASDATAHGPAGGLHHYGQLLDMLGVFMGPVAAVLIGAEAGAGDLAAGVFRDNVLTGRSRLALFAARIPAALIVTFAVTALGFAVALGSTFAFAGGLPTPTISVILESVAWLALANGVVCVIAIGLATLTGSRPGTITALIGWELVLSPLLVQQASLGSLRNGLLDGVLLFLKPGPMGGAPAITMAVGVAVAVIVLWMVALPALGAWRTQTRDA
jgi:hypothetical protein